ncbi:AAA family ATPase [Plebeiibacterium sediminum]|uniref:AAA family ATPase n=1 Tax=Plebeiibacterium sediminum TaxID=2992112 RepID=A0AAE3SFA5_9BACT|nr:AAA family ATPase [Plebeiobacterium sediminum]MCW3787228.1 AAA family ATPase [Plebeiobacterium sediminum]
MITRIHIKGYKSIKELDLRLKPINILLGSNGVGKSNFISIFSLLRNIYNKNFQNYVKLKGGADSLLHFGKKETNSILFDICFGGLDYDRNRFIINLTEAQDNLFIESVQTAFMPQVHWHFQDFETNVEESNFSSINRGQAYYVNDYLKEFDVYHFHDTGDKSPMKGNCNIHDNWKLNRDGSNLAAFLYFLKIKHKKNFIRIEKTIQSIAPFFDKFDLKPNRLNEEKIQLEWKESGYPDAYFNAYHLSDGTLRFICLATLLMQPNPPKTIIIDEPELGLHPVAINKLAALIRKVSEETQVIVSTQSVNLIDNFDPEDIIVTDRKDKSSTFRRLTSEELAEWKEEYSLGDMWGKNLFGAQPYSI